MPRRTNWAQKTDPTRYGPEHRAERARWKPTVEAGNAYCQQGIPGNGSSGRCLHRTRTIYPGQRWALGHNDTGTAWIGPVHTDCNQHDAASRGGQVVAQRRANNSARRTPAPTTGTPRQGWHSRTW